MSRKKASFTGQVGEAVAGCGQTRYRIHKETGITQSTLSRLVSGKGWVDLATMNILAEYLGLAVTIKTKGERPGKKQGTAKHGEPIANQARRS